MNGNMRTKLYGIIAQRDGEYCKCCGKLPCEGQVVVDHKDNNNKNNDLVNLQLLCRRCNYLKNPRRPVDLCVNDEAPNQTELEINRSREPLFRRTVYHEINEKTQVLEFEIINTGAELTGVSPVTAKRYLNKMCSSAGPLERKLVVKSWVISYKKERDHI